MQKEFYVIVGLGITGVSCAHFLKKQNIPFAVTDSRKEPPNLSKFREAFPEITVSVGKLDKELISRATRIVLSPGVAPSEPALVDANQQGALVVGDVELFAEVVNAPVIAITGTNAKSTVTTLIGEMAKQSGIKVAVGGNLGLPALDLLSPEIELYILELSSFQLETTYSLAPAVATILNITPDHMDRYHTLLEYIQAKQRIYHDAKSIVCNQSDPNTESPSFQGRKFYFTLEAPSENTFGILKENNQHYLAFENQPLLNCKELPVLGRHYQANALACLAIGYAFGFPMEAMLQTLREFKGLVHRCQLIRDEKGVRWYNDSKGTNVGATLAAIDGLGPETTGKLILIAGGLGKNADFSPLVPAIEKYVKEVILIGEAAKELESVIGNTSKTIHAKDMQEAVMTANCIANNGDAVLLSPACASYDMFKNFEHRGEVFTSLVQNL